MSQATRLVPLGFKQLWITTSGIVVLSCNWMPAHGPFFRRARKRFLSWQTYGHCIKSSANNWKALWCGHLVPLLQAKDTKLDAFNIFCLVFKSKFHGCLRRKSILLTRTWNEIPGLQWNGQNQEHVHTKHVHSVKPLIWRSVYPEIDSSPCHLSWEESIQTGGGQYSYTIWHEHRGYPRQTTPFLKREPLA